MPCPWSRSDQSMHLDHNTGILRCLVRMEVFFWIDICHIEDYSGKETLPAECHGREGYVADTKNCSCYFHCEAGLSLHSCCRSGLHFNPRTSTCDWPWRTDCHGTPGNSSLGIPQLGVQCPPCNCRIPHQNQCHQFYQCLNDQAFLMECPPGLAFNPTTMSCDYIHLAGCQPGECRGKTDFWSIFTYITMASVHLDGGCCPEANGDFPVEGHCDQFYQCRSGTALRRTCPEGLHFNPLARTCDWPATAGCDGLQYSAVSKPRPTPVPGKPCGAPYGDFNVYPDGFHCERFRSCQSGREVQDACSSGLLFSPALLACDLPARTSCLPLGTYLTSQ
ncbi:Cpap3-d2 [Cordylochernes scorpioides]|uniref:Cpap3-d2 n=1 Tax=Cordylochernes scorpioides TaxID=51811 RepID=A0ABY6KPN6_9ARAC|nr:Cpap3-d2 [Cordylochernes scorpioides]